MRGSILVWILVLVFFAAPVLAQEESNQDTMSEVDRYVRLSVEMACHVRRWPEAEAHQIRTKANQASLKSHGFTRRQFLDATQRYGATHVVSTRIARGAKRCPRLYVSSLKPNLYTQTIRKGGAVSLWASVLEGGRLSGVVKGDVGGVPVDVEFSHEDLRGTSLNLAWKVQDKDVSLVGSFVYQRFNGRLTVLEKGRLLESVDFGVRGQ